MRAVRSGRLIKLALGGILSMMGEWMTQQMMGGMAGRLGQTPLAAHVTMQVRTSATDSLVAALLWGSGSGSGSGSGCRCS